MQYTVTKKKGSELKVGDEVWTDEDNKFTAITEEHAREIMAENNDIKQLIYKTIYLVRLPDTPVSEKPLSFEEYARKYYAKEFKDVDWKKFKPTEDFKNEYKGYLRGFRPNSIPAEEAFEIREGLKNFKPNHTQTRTHLESSHPLYEIEIVYRNFVREYERKTGYYPTIDDTVWWLIYNKILSVNLKNK